MRRARWLHGCRCAETVARHHVFFDFFGHVQEVVDIHDRVETRRSEGEAFLQPDVECARERKTRSAVWKRLDDIRALREPGNDDETRKWLAVLVAGDRSHAKIRGETIDGRPLDGVRAVAE